MPGAPAIPAFKPVSQGVIRETRVVAPMIHATRKPHANAGLSQVGSTSVVAAEMSRLSGKPMSRLTQRSRQMNRACDLSPAMK